MAIGWNKNSIVGSPLDQEVLAQLERRRKVYSKKIRSNEDTQFLNANSIWIRMMSSVDVEAAATPETGVAKTYTNELAKRNILLNGTLSIAGKNRYGAPVSMQPERQRGDEAYDVTLPDGMVPMPGITGFQVESKNSFGTVRLAKIEFSVHSGDQLSRLEQLYMRPGYDILVEWGHTLYLDNKGEIFTGKKSISSDYFMTANGSQKAIMDGLMKVRKLTDYNTDGFLGRCTNFSWKMNGSSYDCSIDIISNGDLLESVQLAMNKGKKAASQSEDKLGYFSQEDFSTDMHEYLGVVKHTKKKFDSISLYQHITTQLKRINFNLELYIDEYAFVENNTGRPGDPGYIETEEKRFRYQSFIGSRYRFGPQQDANRYTDIATILALLNRVFLPKTENAYRNLIKFWVGDVDNKTNPRTPFLTYQDHFALDAKVALLPKTKPGDFISPLSLKFNTFNGAIDDILNIHVNVQYVLDMLTRYISGTSYNAASCLKFVKEMMSGIQHTLGNINDFDVTFEEETGTYYIVDRKIVPDKEALQKLESKIDIVGLGSTVEEVTITSKLSSAIGNQVAITATAVQSDMGSDFLNMQKWNQGLVNRHRTEYSATPHQKQKKLEEAPEITPEDEARLKTFVKNQSDLNALRTTANSGQSEAPVDADEHVLEYVASEVAALINIHAYITQQQVGIEIRKKKSNPPGLIPIELSFKIKGISNVKIGQAFILANEQILPERYRGNIGFMITGLTQSADGNRWITTIKAQMILISKFEVDIPEQGEDSPEAVAENYATEPYVPPADPAKRNAISSLQLSDPGLEIIKKSEAFRANAYRDPGTGDQPYTIGYGTTVIDGNKVKLGQVITEPAALSLMKRQINNTYAAAVKRYVTVDLTQNEFDALVSFTYNVGPGNLQISSLRRKLNSKDYLAAADQFLVWNKSGGSVMRGLTKRREEERDLFLKDSPGNAV